MDRERHEPAAATICAETLKPTRTKMVEILVNDRERWDTTKKRPHLPDAAMPGVHSLRREVSNAMRELERNEGKEG